MAKNNKTSDYGLSRDSKNKQHNYHNNRDNSRKPFGNNFRDNRPSGRQNFYNNSDDSEVTAPYNFVPLNTSVLPSPLNQYVGYEYAKADKDVRKIQNDFAKYVQCEGKLCGYIRLDVETLTPLYIEKDNMAFSDGKNLCIPGSSMRGAIKNLFKIVTNSSLRCAQKAHDADITDRHLYYRSFASGNKAFRKLYMERVKPEGCERQTKEGFLVRKGEAYAIYEAECNIIPTDTTEKANWFVGYKDNGKPDFKPYINWDTGGNFVDVYTGPMENRKYPERSKKHYYRFVNVHWDKEHRVEQQIIDDYKEDNSRGRLYLLDDKNDEDGSSTGLTKDKLREKNISFLKNATTTAGINIDFDYIVPCFYIESGDEVAGFGAGPYFRIPYEKSIAAHIPAAINQNKVVDYTEAVFGSKEFWASRVFFEDLYLNDILQDSLLLPASQVKILEEPKPTSYQNYLEPVDKEVVKTAWESESLIRGYKLYWHQENDKDSDWKAKTPVPNSYRHIIAPVKAGKRFVGKVRFENLTESELGALLFVLGLCNEQKPELRAQDKQYVTLKIGMGKPVGLGSISITSDLFLAPDNYYTSLFGNSEKDCFNLPDAVKYSAEEEIASIQKCVNAFVDVIKNTGNYNKNYIQRIGELKSILDATYRQKMTKKARYLDVNNRNDKNLINKRISLPRITEVKNSLL